MADTLLVVNAGSSSIKFQLFRVGDAQRLELAFKGQMEGIGTQPHLIAKDGAGATLIDERYEPAQVGDTASALGQLGDWLVGPARRGRRRWRSATASCMAARPTARRLWSTMPWSRRWSLWCRWRRCTSRTIWRPFARSARRYPQIPQVACFDTAFHRGHPEVADRYAIADSWYQAGVRRYGFHGLSYEYIAGRLRELDPALARAGWWSATWARVPRCARSGTAGAWTARWASPPSTACRWAPAPASSIPA